MTDGPEKNTFVTRYGILLTETSLAPVADIERGQRKREKERQ